MSDDDLMDKIAKMATDAVESHIVALACAAIVAGCFYLALG